MDAGITDMINRRDAELIAARLDHIDSHLKDVPGPRWFSGNMAATILGENDSQPSDRAWLVTVLASNIPGIRFDGAPADGDWDNLYRSLRAEIEARRTRDPEVPHAQTGEIHLGGVV